MKHERVSTRRCLFAVALATACSLAGPLHAEQTKIYSWTDAQGVIHFSDSMVPPEHIKDARSITVRSYRQPAGAASDTIPLETRDGDPTRKWVRASLEGERGARDVMMVVDTGAQTTMLDESLAGELGLEPIAATRLVGVTGSADGWIGRLPRLKLGSEEVTDLNVVVGPVPGLYLLGMDVLHQLELTVGQDSLRRESR